MVVTEWVARLFLRPLRLVKIILLTNRQTNKQTARFREIRATVTIQNIDMVGNAMTEDELIGQRGCLANKSKLVSK